MGRWWCGEVEVKVWGGDLVAVVLVEHVGVGGGRLDEEAHDDVGVARPHAFRKVPRDLVDGEVDLALAERLDTQAAELDKGLLGRGQAPLLYFDFSVKKRTIFVVSAKIHSLLSLACQ